MYNCGIFSHSCLTASKTHMTQKVQLLLQQYLMKHILEKYSASYFHTQVKTGKNQENEFITIDFTISSNTHRDEVILTGITHNVNAPKNLNDFHNYITKFTYLLTYSIE